MTKKTSDAHSGRHEFGDDGDGQGCGIDSDSLGSHLSMPSFIALVDAILVKPSQDLAAGRNGTSDASSNLFWVYDREEGLTVKTQTGFLKTAAGDGGFNLHVGTDGSWSLQFSGSGTTIGHHANNDGDSEDAGSPVPPPAPGLNVINVSYPNNVPGPASVDASAKPPSLINGGIGWDTVQGGAGDYMIGGSGTLGGGLAGAGNCALYSKSPGSVLVDMQNGFGYGSNAEGNVYVNMNQVRGSLFSNVLIGSSDGTDLKSGGSNSLLISTGGTGFEMRPDGSGNVLVSTVGSDRIVFDPTHGWALGDQNIMLGFDDSNGDALDFTVFTTGATPRSNFHLTSAAGYNAGTGTGDISDYVKIINQADGSHVLFSATGQVQTAGVEVIDLKFTHGLSVTQLYAEHQILI